MEWQAWYAAGSILMPKSALSQIVPDLRDGGENEDELVASVSTQFQVSRDAARVRLTRLGFLNRS